MAVTLADVLIKRFYPWRTMSLGDTFRIYRYGVDRRGTQLAHARVSDANRRYAPKRYKLHKRSFQILVTRIE